MSNLLKNNALLMQEYDYKKNSKIDLEKITIGTNKKIWWQCEKGHEWEAAIASRSKGHGCPYCNNLKAWAGFNDMATTNPEIAELWNYEKNGLLKPSDVLAGSHRVVWWKCVKGHEWEEKIKDRTSRKECPYCSNSRVLSGYNDLATTNPELLNEWNYERNGGLSPSQISAGSEKKVWWICEKGHEWEAIVYNRKKGVGCPYCQNRVVLAGYNDLATINPKLAKEWNHEKNGGLTPSKVLFGAHKKVWWKCSVGHEWKAEIKERTAGRNCPYCSNKKVLQGYNDLITTNPSLAKEWSSKNNILPNEIIAGADKKYYWTCPVGHADYLMSVDQRKRGQGCPECAKQSQTSFPEQSLYFYVKQLFPEAVNRYVVEKRELDIFIPSKKIGIEYDGYFSHKGKDQKDAEKTAFFLAKGIKVLRIKEYKKDEERKDSDFYIHERTTNETISKLIRDVICELSQDNSVDVDCERDQVQIKEQYIDSIKKNSIVSAMPEIISEWDCEKNGTIKPEYVSRNSRLKYYWICPVCNYSYLAAPTSRYRGSGCPACAGKVVHSGYNDLKTKHPELLKDWDYERNDGIDPSKIFYRSEELVWWKCPKGHSWQKSVASRSKNRSVCPYCTGRSLIKGFNDLKTKRPDLADEWDYSLNPGTPDNIHFNNQTEIVHWVCKECGYKWTHTVCNRNRCPECLRKRTQINVYNASDLIFYGSFENARSFCEHLGLDYSKKQQSISNVCRRVRKTFMGKYILRYPIDDEYEQT